VRQAASLTTANAEASAQSEAETATDRAATGSTSQTIELAFSGPCWVDIRDSTGKVLLFGEMKRDSRETLAGEPPYSLVIGNAAAAEITVAGQPFNLTSVARGNVARFKLDPAEVSRQTTDTSADTSADADTE
jgi:cytoskeleton protein RodZ